VNRCIGCNQGCIGHYHAGVPIACTVNPWAGYELTLRRARPALEPRRVVVVGGGPAGCAAAAAAAGDGHAVVLFERSPSLGGQMRLALANPGHAEVATLLAANLERWVAAGVDVRLSTEAGTDAVLAERPHRVIVATGAREHVRHLSGDGVGVVGVASALAGAGVGRRVVVYDWGGGWAGLDAAEALAGQGCAVRLITSAVAFGEGVHQYVRNLYLQRLDEAGVELLHHLRPVALRPGAVACEHVFSRREVALEEVDTLVMSAGREPDDALFARLEACGVRGVRVGDALGPRGIEEAIREGTLAGFAVSEDVAGAA
jgi:NADPH-dependent 2,4-dienoyl-CoA reductase/sulfur reductase-like enzyme